MSFLKPEYDPEVLQKLVERMARARWIESALVTPDPVAIIWSAKGRERMSEIIKIMNKYAPQLFDQTDSPKKKIGVISYLIMSFRIDHIAARELLSLKSPNLSLAESRTLLGLAIANKERFGSPIAGNSRS